MKNIGQDFETRTSGIACSTISLHDILFLGYTLSMLHTLSCYSYYIIIYVIICENKILCKYPVSEFNDSR